MSRWQIDKFSDAYFFSDEENLWPENYDVSRLLTRREINKLAGRPHIKAIKIGGLGQDTFEYFIERFGQQFEVINFWKCPLVTDFSRLASLSSLQYVVIFWNQRAERLWDMGGNGALKGVYLSDFSRLHRLDDLSSAPALEELHFGDAVWDGFVVETLRPLEHCVHLRYLDFTGKKIVDGDPSSIAALQRLEELSFPDRFFTTEQLAWLTAKLPEVKSGTLAPVYMTEPVEYKTAKGVKYKDTYILGKGKPFLDSKADRLRIEKYVREFELLVKRFRLNPQEPCPTAS